MDRPKELKVGDKFKLRVNGVDAHFPTTVQKGTVVTLIVDDNTNSPLFRMQDGTVEYVYFNELLPLERTELQELECVDQWCLSFGEALSALKDGEYVSRAGWNGKGMWLHIQRPDEHSKMRQPYIYMSPADGKLIPWLASQADMLAEDWGIV